MRFAIATDGGLVAAHFGRCPVYTICETDAAGSVVSRTTAENPGHQPGMIPAFLKQLGVECVVTGGMGVRARDIFAAEGISVILGAGGPIDGVVAMIGNGTLTDKGNTCSPGAGKGSGVEKSVCDHGGEEIRCPRAPAGLVCVTADGQNLDSPVDPRFGRCRYFVFVDEAAQTLEAVENPYREFAGGAGIQAASSVASKNARAVVTGDVGPNAYRVLADAGIPVATGASGTVREALAALKAGSLSGAAGPTVPKKSGMTGS